jgi:hypothetical protein
MQIDDSDRQSEKANPSIPESFEPGSNVKLKSASHPEKHEKERTSIGSKRHTRAHDNRAVG